MLNDDQQKTLQELKQAMEDGKEYVIAIEKENGIAKLVQHCTPLFLGGASVQIKEAADERTKELSPEALMANMILELNKQNKND